MARPNKYSKKIVQKICKLLETDSYTNSELAAMAGVSEASFYEWKAKKPEFVEALEK
jgi:transposase